MYNYVVSHQDRHLLYNGLSGACIILDSNEYARFLCEACYPEEMQELLRLGFFIEDDFSEPSAVLYHSRRLTAERNTQFYRIYTTLACNAHCYYCYERGCAPIAMSTDTANMVAQFIIDRMVSNSDIGIEWFGGEPLLNVPIITLITSRVLAACGERNIHFWSRMVSNGILFDQNTIETAKEKWNLRHVQITLDGLKETYERIKSFSALNSFEKVIGNIDLLLQHGIKVTVRLNYSDDNLDEIKATIDYLAILFGDIPGFRLYFHRIMDANADNSALASDCSDIELLEKCIQKGLVRDVLGLLIRRDEICSAHMIRSYLILPNGNLGKCSQACTAGDVVGDVFHGVDEKRLVRWCSPLLPKQCMACKLLPLCNGGCMYERFANKPFCFFSEKKVNYILTRYLQDYCDQEQRSER